MGSIDTRSTRQYRGRDRDGKEVRLFRSCAIEDYLSNLGAEDECGPAADRPEASCGCFYWADRIEATGATCFVLDPRRFRIVTDSWNKTDRQDARNMAKALWVFLVTGEFGIPTVYKPSETIRTLRRLFATYNLLNRQIRILKNAIQAMLTDDGVVLTSAQLSRLFAGRESVAEILSERSLSTTIVSAFEMQAALLRQLNESKVALPRQILVHSGPLADQITLLVTIPGITPLTAAAFLADIGDVRRFKSLRHMNAYLRLVSRCHDSGVKSRSGAYHPRVTQAQPHQPHAIDLPRCEEHAIVATRLRRAQGAPRRRASSHRDDSKALRGHETDDSERRWIGPKSPGPLIPLTRREPTPPRPTSPLARAALSLWVYHVVTRKTLFAAT